MPKLTHDPMHRCAQLVADHMNKTFLGLHQLLQTVNDEFAVALLLRQSAREQAWHTGLNISQVGA